MLILCVYSVSICEYVDQYVGPWVGNLTHSCLWEIPYIRIIFPTSCNCNSRRYTSVTDVYMVLSEAHNLHLNEEGERDSQVMYVSTIGGYVMHLEFCYIFRTKFFLETLYPKEHFVS